MTVSLKDLDDAQFAERYGADRFTATVLSSRMRYIVQHMCTGLLNNAFSLILRDWYDFAATISGPPELNYPMSSVSNSLAMFLGTMSEAVRNTIEEYGPENLRPGDVVICNDPYRAGNHVNDVCFIRPVFVDGRVISFVTLRAHQLDMGGVVPAGFSGTKRNVYENGLVIAPTLLYRDDKPIKSAFNLIFDNARYCALLLPDIKTIYANLLLGERLIQESVERYGAEAYLGAIRYSTDVSAEAMSTALAALPDGVYEAEEGIDCDGVDDSVEYRIKVRITKAGHRMELDFSGTSPQARTSINAGILDTKTAVGVALKFLIDPATPFTSGAYRDIDIVLPAGTFISATPPDGAVFLYWESTGPVLLAVFRALEKALGRKAVGGDYGSLNIHNANGVLEDGTPWVTTAQCGGEHGPWGATEAGDADSYSVVYQANNLDPATEAIESELPAVVLRKEYVPDSSGAGAHRGGAAVLKDTLYLTAAEHWSSPLHTKSPSGLGVYGGKSGALGATWLFHAEDRDVVRTRELLATSDDVYALATPVAGMLDPETKRVDPDGEYFYFASTPVWHTQPHAVFRYLTNGGGGWGNPLERDPERVKRDVRDEYVTVEGAYRDYGVVVTGDPRTDPEGLRVDEEATRRRRAELAAQ
ncbi:N-methylhydantoinase B [Amycolatopsis bartoniae]|uniref:5-oxoprolinase n=1 Tax=Amycolatopsis bartoniae TaxID=941986 RepID=A0A8H9IVB6_9PSEU|nr:hydantoinase B/oxoprolinase family protein [Amycolatopsis bartoniae]MBB2938581.1 N-methylhydantoinase B [Amycolatopsis bartoniae]TVT08915.1 hydantoinase B/oxoprolinase family protein [Amycolatopsis bartoniae]GHF69974.1 5-oxoprolinase [Amycolatopsis bartoniae]